jgi:kynureninase
VAASLGIFQKAGIPALAAKSKSLTGYLAWLIQARFADRIESITPESARGCQLSLRVRDERVDARLLFNELCKRNVTGDWREPDVIRVAPTPLYNSYSDVFEFAERLQDALST